MWNITKSRMKGKLCIQYNERTLTRLVTSCIGNVFYDMLLKERLIERQDEEEDLTLSKR